MFFCFCFQTVDVFPVTALSCASMIPLDALRCQKLKPPTRRRDRDLVAVVVERIESPSHFYIRFDEDQEARTLENMMFQMRLFFILQWSKWLKGEVSGCTVNIVLNVNFLLTFWQLSVKYLFNVKTLVSVALQTLLNYYINGVDYYINKLMVWTTHIHPIRKMPLVACQYRKLSTRNNFLFIYFFLLHINVMFSTNKQPLLWPFFHNQPYHKFPKMIVLPTLLQYGWINMSFKLLTNGWYVIFRKLLSLFYLREYVCL